MVVKEEKKGCFVPVAALAWRRMAGCEDGEEEDGRVGGRYWSSMSCGWAGLWVGRNGEEEGRRRDLLLGLGLGLGLVLVLPRDGDDDDDDDDDDDAWVGGGGKRGGVIEMGGVWVVVVVVVAQERWRWRRSARRVDINVSRM